ncbi:unnamed protein product [Choristocarpus tenellus]
MGCTNPNSAPYPEGLEEDTISHSSQRRQMDDTFLNQPLRGNLHGSGGSGNGGGGDGGGIGRRLILDGDGLRPVEDDGSDSNDISNNEYHFARSYFRSPSPASQTAAMKQGQGSQRYQRVGAGSASTASLAAGATRVVAVANEGKASKGKGTVRTEGVSPARVKARSRPGTMGSSRSLGVTLGSAGTVVDKPHGTHKVNHKSVGRTSPRLHSGGSEGGGGTIGSGQLGGKREGGRASSRRNTIVSYRPIRRKSWL